MQQIDVLARLDLDSFFKTRLSILLSIGDEIAYKLVTSQYPTI